MTTNAVAFAVLVQSIVAHMDSVPSRDKEMVSAMVWSIAGVESTWENKRPYPDVNGRAWGYFGMHRTRWGEIQCSVFSVQGTAERTEWGAASARVQIKCMAAAIANRLQRSRRASLDPFTQVCLWHNGFGGKPKARADYQRKVRNHLDEWEKLPEVNGMNIEHSTSNAERRTVALATYR